MDIVHIIWNTYHRGVLHSVLSKIKAYDPLAKTLGPGKMKDHIELIEQDMKNIAVKSLVGCSSVCSTADHWTLRASGNGDTDITAH